MKNLAGSKRYAKALVSIGLEDHRLEKYVEELSRVQEALKSEEIGTGLKKILFNPTLSIAERTKFLNELAQYLNLSDDLLRFLILLLEERRIEDIAIIIKIFNDLADEALGRIKVRVKIPKPLAPREIDDIHKNLARLLNKEVILVQELDPSLLGGIVAEIGGLVIDGSLKTRLEHLKEFLSGAE